MRAGSMGAAIAAPARAFATSGSAFLFSCQKGRDRWLRGLGRSTDRQGQEPSGKPRNHVAGPL